jgi:hypothetical protein
MKITMRRPRTAGDIGETDVYGAQQHAPLLGLVIELPASGWVNRPNPSPERLDAKYVPENAYPGTRDRRFAGGFVRKSPLGHPHYPHQPGRDVNRLFGRL